MKKPKKHSPAELDWASLRIRYEAGLEKVADISLGTGLGPNALTFQARSRGWTLRSQRRTKTRPRIEPKTKIETAKALVPDAPIAKPIASTKEAIQRLKILVQQRIARLEELNATIGNDNGGNGNGEGAERAIRSANMLARTLEKVLELEQQQRKFAKLSTASSKRFDDTWRHELAGRIARLGVGTGVQPVQQPQPGGSAGADGGLAAMGA